MSNQGNSTTGSGHAYGRCTQVSALCPVTATTLGYYPTAGFNYFFAVGFGLAGIITLITGIWKRTWSYMAFIAAGSFLELAGYAGRVPLTANPWNQDAFETQICAIVLAPTLICISIYLTLKHVTLSLSPAISRVRPRFYPLIFVPADVSCLLVQGVGGALAASGGSSKPDLVKNGNRLIVAGIALQVLVLLFFGAVSTDYYLRVRRWIRSSEAEPASVALWQDKRFRLFIYAVAGAYAAILLRCIYRIAEMANGWGNYIMQDEPSFIALESFMILIAVWLLACFPPGFLFPHMARQMAAKKAKKGKPATATEDTDATDVEKMAAPASPRATGGL